MKIHIMGASGAGSTTLGMALSRHLSFPYFDTDNYFWDPAGDPFTLKRDPELRNQMLMTDLVQHNNWIVGGSMVSWGAYWQIAFDLVVFLYVPPQIRLKRLEKREHERYGDIIFTDPVRNQKYQEFMSWAKSYEDIDSNRRSLRVHEEWLETLICPVIEIRGDTTVEDRVQKVLTYMEQL